MKRYKFIIAFLFISTLIDAQILNTDRISAFSDSTTQKKLYTLLQFGLVIDDQINTVIIYNGKADLSYFIGKHSIILVGKLSKTTSDEFEIINTAYTHLRFMLNKDEKSSPEFFTQYQYDKVRGMLDRYLLGSNIKYRLYKTKNGTMHLATGFMYESERWNYHSVPDDKIPANPEDVTTSLIKSNTYVKFNQKITENVDLGFITYYQGVPGNDFFKPRLSSTLEFNMQFSKKLSFVFQLETMYDYKVVVPVKSFYYILSNSISIQL